MLLCWLAMLLVACYACTHIAPSDDVWVALACGRHHITHGVSTVEPFGVTSYKAVLTDADIVKWPGPIRWIANKVGTGTVNRWCPSGWINQNWLAHVLFYWLTYSSPFADAEHPSFNSLVYWKFAVYLIAIICVFYTSVILGVNPVVAAAFSCFAMFVSRSFLDIRPADFTNMLLAIFLLILALTTYRSSLYIWLIVPLMIFWANVHGGYIYGFIILAAFVLTNLFTSFFKKYFTTIGLRGVCHSITAGSIALLAVVLFNPFHLTNLTHVWVVGFGKDAQKWRSIYEWGPAFEQGNPIGDSGPFLILCIIALLTFLAWAVVAISNSLIRNRLCDENAKNSHILNPFRVDLPMIIIAAMTIYMALVSRRFIPMASIVACPIIAMLISRMIVPIMAIADLNKDSHQFFVISLLRQQLLLLTAVVTAIVFVFGAWCVSKFNQVYLKPWPYDDKINSIFMRMTSANDRPFEACDFIRKNKLTGKMFNDWIDGGFIAWQQEPDPNTGCIPLQLFIDGRAQAAYDRRDFDAWSEIIAGGPIGKSAKLEKRELNNTDYIGIGEWAGKMLREHDIWLVLMPLRQFDSAFVKGLESNPNWPVVFISDKQMIFVNINTSHGKELFDGIFDNKTLYPDYSYKNMILAYYIFLSGGMEKHNVKDGLDLAIDAFYSKSYLPALTMILSADKNFPDLKPYLNNFYENYLNDYLKKRNLYVKQSGYYNRAVAAFWIAGKLQETAEKQYNYKFYDDIKKESTKELNQLVKTLSW